jgi:hypothetical protein
MLSRMEAPQHQMVMLYAIWPAVAIALKCVADLIGWTSTLTAAEVHRLRRQVRLQGPEILCLGGLSLDAIPTTYPGVHCQ